MADEAATPAVPEIPEDLDSLNDDALRGLHGELMAARAALLVERNEDGTSLARLREIRSEVQRIDTAAASIATAVTERMEIATDPQLSDDAAPGLPEVPAPVEASDDEPPAEPVDAPADPVAVTAAVSLTDIVENREPGTPPPADTPSRPRVASLVAPAGSRIAEPSSDMGMDEIAGAFTDLIRGESFEGKVRVASLTAFEAEPALRDSILTTDSASRNDALIRQAQADWRTQYEDRRAARASGARTAAICDPLDIIREIPNCVQAEEPFSDSLPSRPAGRLGFQYTPAMSLATIAAGVSIWTDTNQASVVATDQSTWKPCVDVVCPTPQSVRALAVVGCFKADNTTDMSNPERVRDAMNKINAQRARSKTGRLLQIADTLSSHFEFSAPYGALPGIIQAILTTLPQGEYPERLDDGTPYVLYTPPGMLEALVIDSTNRAFPIDTGAVISYIERECAAAGWNVSVVDLEDVAEGGQVPFASLPAVGVGNKVSLPALGGTTRPFTARLLAPESALYFSTGAIEMGIERSPELNRQNKFQWFAEEYVGLAKNGCHPWYTLHLTLCPNGTVAALTSPYACPTTSS